MHGGDEQVPELADPLVRDAETQALDHIQLAADVKVLKALKPRERQALYVKASAAATPPPTRRIMKADAPFAAPAKTPDERVLRGSRDGAEKPTAAPNGPYDPHHLQGQAVAIAGVDRFHPVPHIDRLPSGSSRPS